MGISSGTDQNPSLTSSKEQKLILSVHSFNGNVYYKQLKAGPGDQAVSFNNVHKWVAHFCGEYVVFNKSQIKKSIFNVWILGFIRITKTMIHFI